VSSWLTVARAFRSDAADNGDVVTWRRRDGQVCRRARHTLISYRLHANQVATVEAQVVDLKRILLHPEQSPNTSVLSLSWKNLADKVAYGSERGTSISIYRVYKNKYIGPPPYCRTEMYVGRVAFYPHGESQRVRLRDRQTDGRTPDRYITLSTLDAASEIIS